MNGRFVNKRRHGLGEAEEATGVEPLMGALKRQRRRGQDSRRVGAGTSRRCRAMPGLIEALTDGTVREDVARVLKKIGDTRAVDALIGGLMGTNWMVRRHAAEALRKDRRCAQRRCLDPVASG